MYDPSLLSTDAGLSGSGSAGLAGAQAGVSGSAASGGTAGASAGHGGSGADDNEAGAAGATPGSEGGGAGTAGGGTAGGGASAGTSGSSGAAGSGGNAGGSAGGTVLALELISNMESSTTLDPTNGRNGDFYVGHDLTAGTQFPGSPFVMSALPTSDARYSASDKMAAMTSGMGFTDWGENIGFNFNLVSGNKRPVYNASAYCGLHFFVKVGASPAATRAIVRFTDKYSLPDGGVCGVGGSPCYHYFQKQFDFTPTWQEKSVLFTDFTCLDCQKPALDPSVLYGVEFGLPANGKFELWFDDISFLKKDAGGCPKSL